MKSLIVTTTQMKTTEQYFPLVLFQLCNFGVCEVLSRGAVYYAEQSGSNLSLTVDKILKCDHLNESY